MRISKGTIFGLAILGGGAYLAFFRKKPAAAAPELEDGGDVDETTNTITLPDVPSPGEQEANLDRLRSDAGDLLRSGGFIDSGAPAPAPGTTIPIPSAPPIPPEVDETLPIRSPGLPPTTREPQITPGIPDIVRQIPVPGGIDLPNPIPVPPRPPTASPAPRPAPAPAPAPNVPPPAPQDDVPDDTAELVAMMLEAEGAPGWKREIPELADWLEARGQSPSTKFGPGSAALMAEEIGTLPIIRFWPSASGRNPKKALTEYRAKLAAIARDMDEPHASQLRASAQRETGQSFGPPQGDGGRAAISPTIGLEIS
jgi:hypothetical protein